MQNLETSESTVFQLSTDHSDVGARILQLEKYLGRAPCKCADIEVVTKALQRSRNQLAGHSRSIDDRNMHSFGLLLVWLVHTSFPFPFDLLGWGGGETILYDMRVLSASEYFYFLMLCKV